MRVSRIQQAHGKYLKAILQDIICYYKNKIVILTNKFVRRDALFNNIIFAHVPQFFYTNKKNVTFTKNHVVLAHRKQCSSPDNFF